ncbi:hypothetical protein BDZ91DRAFT_742462, partial [Kalaharituber pfeilii]
MHVSKSDLLKYIQFSHSRKMMAHAQDLPRTTVKQLDRISTESEPRRSIVSLFPKIPSSFL